MEQVEGKTHLPRLIYIMSLALKVFKDKKFAIHWLNSSKTLLGGKIPLQLLNTEAGTNEIKNLLGRIEHGVYS